MRLSILLLASAAAVVSSGRLVGQQFPLPQNMIASFSDSWAEEMWLPTQLGTDIVNAKISFDNSAEVNRVSILWIFQKTGAVPGTASLTTDVSFRPTAIARRAGKSMKFYVVGWSDRTGRVIVESWTFGQFVLGSAVAQGGQLPLSTFSAPGITRVVEWISDPNTVPPIWDAGCQVYGNKLLLLANSSPTKIWSLNLASLVVSELYSASTFPGLEGHRMLVVARHAADGLVAVSEPRKVWDPPMSPTALSGSVYLVMRDVNSDGTFDFVQPVNAADYYNIYAPPWDNKFAEP